MVDTCGLCKTKKTKEGHCWRPGGGGENDGCCPVREAWMGKPRRVVEADVECPAGQSSQSGSGSSLCTLPVPAPANPMVMYACQRWGLK